ncbi:zinc-binding metallopeptidase family protein [Anaerovorax odorimutans]|uniref:hypothetical protein n=1 Tax=Anaerovorax odorimutans TaxID=109327 RepID=UPI00041008BD|nr:hypothetical protein [Anaerovorax odorimutans]
MKKKILVAILIICIIFIFIPKNGEEKPVAQTNPIENGILQEYINLSEIPANTDNILNIRNYLKNWAKEMGYKVYIDKTNNVIIEKPASEGYENAPTSILQGHINISDVNEMDTVNIDNTTEESINDSKDKEMVTASNIKLESDGKADIASILSILKNAENHGPLRAIFTIGKENSFTGAKQLNSKYLKADYLINLNSESDYSFCNSSVSLTTFEMTKNVSWQAPHNKNAYEVTIRDLNGGLTEDKKNNKDANAIKVLGNLLAQAQSEGIVLELASFNGGISENEIPTDATAVVVLNGYDIKKFKKTYDSVVSEFKNEFGSTEKNASINLTEVPLPEKVLSREDCNSLISYLYGIVDCVNSMLPDNNNIVESSSNIGTAYTYTGNFSSKISVRSLSDEKTLDLTQSHDTLARICSINHNILDYMPGWPTKENSTLIPSISSIYNKLYNKEIKITPTDSYLECALFYEKNPDLDIISIGNIDYKSKSNKQLYLNVLTKPTTLIIEFLKETKEKPEIPIITDSAITSEGSMETK